MRCEWAASGAAAARTDLTLQPAGRSDLPRAGVIGHPRGALHSILLGMVALTISFACGAAQAGVPIGSNSAGAVRGFPTFPGAEWEGDVTAEEADGQLVWVMSWTARAAEPEVRRYFLIGSGLRSLGRSGWQVRPGATPHELALRRGEGGLRGYLRLRAADLGQTGTAVTLGIRDPRRRPNTCLSALPWLPSYPGARVRGCDAVHVPGARSLSVLMATNDPLDVARRNLDRALRSAGWTSDVTILGVLVFRRATGPDETARVIWGPDPGGSLSTGFMLSIDLPEAALSELPA